MVLPEPGPPMISVRGSILSFPCSPDAWDELLLALAAPDGSTEQPASPLVACRDRPRQLRADPRTPEPDRCACRHLRHPRSSARVNRGSARSQTTAAAAHRSESVPAEPRTEAALLTCSRTIHAPPRGSIWPREDGNAPRSEAGWVSLRDKLHGRVEERRRVVEMALTVIVIRRSTDEQRTLPRLASKRVRDLPGAASAGGIFIAARGPARVASVLQKLRIDQTNAASYQVAVRRSRLPASPQGFSPSIAGRGRPRDLASKIKYLRVERRLLMPTSCVRASCPWPSWPRAARHRAGMPRWLRRARSTGSAR